jgi:hypothetical protein
VGEILLALGLEASNPVLRHFAASNRPFGQPWPGLSN